MLRLLLKLDKGLSWPEINFNTSSRLINETEISAYQKSQLWHIDVLEQFEMTYPNKDANETIVDSSGVIVRDQTLEICNVWYQEIKLNLQIFAAMTNFYPNYRNDFIDYCVQHNIVVDPGPLHQTKFWHAGTLTADFSGDFWWRYKKLRVNNDHNDYVGHSSDTINYHLQYLKDLL
jgi:hypothetical protein